MARRNTLEVDRDGLSVSAAVRSEKLDPDDVAPLGEVVRRDARTGQRVTREPYDRATGDLLEEGYGYRWVDEDGEEVPGEAVAHYEVVDDREQRVQLHEPTLGRGRPLAPVDWVPVGSLGEYLVTSTYEVWGEDSRDVEQLYELAVYVDEHRVAPVVPAVLQPALVESWGIITPQFYGDAFTLLMRVTRTRVAPEHAMAVPEQEGPPHPTQESPFARR